MSLDQNSRALENHEYVRGYYNHQYERVNQLEQQSLTVTNIVVAVTIFAVTFGFRDINSLDQLMSMSLIAAVVFFNLFAIFYTHRTGRAVLAHRKRAYKILEVYASDIFSINNSIARPQRNKLAKVLKVPGRTVLQIGMHLLLIIISILPMVYLT